MTEQDHEPRLDDWCEMPPFRVGDSAERRDYDAAKLAFMLELLSHPYGVLEDG